MRRYFFHLHDDMDVSDPEGRELANLAAASEIAITAARDIAAAHVSRGKLNLGHRIVIADADGVALRTSPFSEIVDVVPA